MRHSKRRLFFPYNFEDIFKLTVLFVFNVLCVPPIHSVLLANSELIDDGEDFVEDIFHKLTDGLGDISGASGEGFDVGGLGDKIGGVLSDFGLNFTSFTSDFKAFYQSFNTSMISGSSEVDLLRSKPYSFSGYINTLQVGSKKSSAQYSAQFKKIIYDKLTSTFPDPQFDGVQIPGLPRGQGSIATVYSCTITSCDFPVNNFRPAIAVAYGHARTFDKASSFTIDTLLVPDFNADAIALLLDRIKLKNPFFDRFSSTEDGLPFDPNANEVFRIDKYLPEIQVALNLATSTDLSAKNFGPQDIFNALFPNPSFPSLTSLLSFAKREILDQINLDFASELTVPPLDISSPTRPTIDSDGFSFGTFSEDSTQLFPPAVDLDSISVSTLLETKGQNSIYYNPYPKIPLLVSRLILFAFNIFVSLQGFQFDFDVDVNGGDLILKASFQLNVNGVNPISVASDAADRIGAALSDASGPFAGIIQNIGSGLDDASEFLNDIANITYLTVKLDAAVDFNVEASLAKGTKLNVTSVLQELSSALMVTLGVDAPLNIRESLPGGFDLVASPKLALELSTTNKATPFDVFEGGALAKLADFSFTGSFAGTCLVSVSDIPVEIIFDVSVPDLTNASSVDFDLSIDVNLVPVKDEIEDLLDLVDLISYSGDGPFAQYERFLPTIDLTCIKDSGKEYLNQANSSLPVSGFFNAIADGCSDNELFELLGGYNSTSGELGMNVQLNVTVARSINDAVRALSGLLSSNGLSLGDDFSTALSSDLEKIEVGGRLFLDLSFGVRGIPTENITFSSFVENFDAYFEINGFELEAYLQGDNITME